MVDLLKITLEDGIPISGDGDVATINALLIDGGMQTFGAKADAAVTNPALSASLIALQKGILTAVNLIAVRLPTALGAGGGMKVDGSGTTLPVSQASVPTHNVFVQQKGFNSQATFTCGTTAYVPGDVVGAGGGGNAALTFAGVASGAAVISIDEVLLEIDTSAIISGETSYRLYLYNVTPPSAFADSAIWDLPAGDRASILTYIDFANIVDLGSTLFVLANPAKIIKTASGSIYGYLVTNGTFTPTARVHKITLATREIG